MNDSDSDIDPKQFKRLYQKLEKKMNIEKQTPIDRKSLACPKTLSQNQNHDQLFKKSPPQQRSRSRQKQNENTSQDIYDHARSIKYMQNLPSRLHKLPIFKKKDQILQKIIKNQIVLITGDTGCGKSTQVPRLIYQYLKKIGSYDKIICVQPRRLAVTSLKTAVQMQLPDNQRRAVGYQIGQKAEFNSQNRIVFMTNGIFLQKITHDTNFLNEYPFVVLDEVHQRDIDTDFILTAIKRIIRGFPKMRVILMSATIDNQLFRYYFASDHIDRFMNEDNFYKKIIEMQEFQKVKEDNKSQDAIEIKDDSDQEEKQKRKIYDTVALKFLDSQFPCPSININQPSSFNRKYFYIDTLDSFIKREHVKKWGAIHWSHRHANTHKELFEAACLILDQIRHNSREKNDLSGEAVLVFLPGLNEIENFNEQIFSFLGGRQKVFKEFQIIHAHSTIMTDLIEQKINTPNKKQIKVIISTNIAQSSITVKGVKYIIDFCLTKEIRYDDKSRMENLELVYSSKASCKQRAGRTGRVCDGIIFRMVEKKFYDQKFDEYSEPQIKRSSLDKLILRIMLMHEHDEKNLFKDPPEVLGTCIQPPHLESIQSSINSLKFCGGIKQHGDTFSITDLGKLYVQIPIDIAYTKLLFTSILFGTFCDALILVSILSQNKNAIHRRQIENNFLKYFDKISNYEYCDFLALVNLFKEEDQFRRQMNNFRHQDKNKNQKNPSNRKDRLNFSIYTQTKNTMEDIMKRLQRKWFNFGELTDYLESRKSQDVREGYDAREIYHIRSLSKKCHTEKHPKPKYTDYFMRWKLTLAFGFVDKLIIIKPPCYDTKQQKRIRDMKIKNISNQRTVVLLTSSQISLPPNPNPETTQKTINHWKNVFKKNVNITLSRLTLTSGLNYLHFDDDIELNKLLFYKEMDSNMRKKGSGSRFDWDNQTRYRQEESKRSFLSVKQLIQCLGDIDYMQQGIPYTLFKENKIRIDQHSLNRVCNYIEESSTQYLITNSFIIKNKYDLVCQYTSALNIFSFQKNKAPNNILHVLVNLLFYPFVKLKANKTQTEYEYLALKKNYMLKIPYDLVQSEIQNANQIRSLIKEFFDFKRKINTQNCSDFYKRVKSFIIKKRKTMINCINDEVWQAQFMNQIKQGKLQPPHVQVNQKKQHHSSQLFSNEILDQINEVQNTNKKKRNQTKDHIIEEPNRTYETRKFMNPIQLPQIDFKQSYFLRAKEQSPESFRNRMSFYIEWKKSKLNQVEDLAKFVLDNDSYLCCGYKNTQTELRCSIPLCKLRRLGPLDENGIFRDMFEPILGNMKQSQQGESQIDYNLTGQNYYEEYTKISCKNNHEVGIRMNDSSKVKILIFNTYYIKYPDIENAPIVQADFMNLEMSHWAKFESAAIKRKENKPLNKNCYLCSFKFSTYQELKNHIKDSYHIEAVEKFKKSIEITEEKLQNCQSEEQDYEQQIGYIKNFQNSIVEENKEDHNEIDY